ncbi:hypothetical protein [Croceibacter atlanticus]|uniref:hypothetical protein n=1 Tax=Croceibacter atlanticus TaxID=313588 RepID=UPI000E7EDBB5|nr:hypothetical protein [Flavobacteriaceae bacterium]
MSPQTIKTLLSLTTLLCSAIAVRPSDGPPAPNSLTPSGPGLPVPIDTNIGIALALGVLAGIYFILRQRRISK